ncbi:sulfotransferase [Actinomadura sp. NEAU-AAG7]|uniref:sulfotransferase family protein n=1 Tax=Actinomadura sp. NEAU-AAG7 TaxID=2839640 RepID=UPI001BE4888B|nr:sulfotransferase [Actinomadura sp. NEAU-AAG7]MBT2206470.1 sulfotransferase [Actinomadura sp. NEAU-AAG7]
MPAPTPVEGHAQDRGTRESPVFVLAPARSCSTSLVAMLSGHDRIYGFPELLLFGATTVAELLDEATRRPNLPKSRVEARLSGPLRAVAEIHEGRQDAPAVERAREWLEERRDWPTPRLFDHLGARLERCIAVEKSTETLMHPEGLRRCFAAFPDARYIHLVRHPVTTARSMREQWRELFPSDGESELLERGASAWYRGHLRAVSALASLPTGRWIGLRAEDVLADPASHLPGVLDWLGLDGGDVALMKPTQEWVFAGAGDDDSAYGEDLGFLRSPETFPPSLPDARPREAFTGLPQAMVEEIGRLARHLGYM